MNVVYIKLLNGDELFAEYVGEENGQVLLLDVLSMEIVATDENHSKYMFMARYTPYGSDHSVSLDKNKIVFMQDATDAVKNHYQTSLKYATQVSDHTFNDGITEATRYLSLILEKRAAQKRQEQTEDTLENVKERILGGYETSSTTKH